MRWLMLSLVGCGALLAAEPVDEVLLDDFERAPQGWKYIDGREFPGAKGGLELDTTVARGGTTSYRLIGDFTGGGAYVGTWRTLDDLSAPDVKEFRLWVKAVGVTALGVRLNDNTGQCHQSKVALQPTEEWQEVTLKVAELVGGEHWGGANDGRWHAPPTGLGLNLGANNVGANRQGTLWLDELRAVVIPPGVPTLLSVELSLPAARPAYGLDLTYRWDAVPMGRDFEVFVHLRGPDGKMFQDDHRPPGGTAEWSGRVDYKRTIVIPTDAPVGDYKVNVGIWDRKANRRLPIKTGDGVVAVGDGAYTAGVLPVAADAPIPRLTGPKLDLTGYKVTFDEDFTEPLSVSAWGPGTRWIAHTPYAGDFGDARFADPRPDFPFTITDGILRFEAKKINGRWHSGLLSSCDPKGNGFAQRYGYFECRAKFPKGPGTWPAFWLLGQPRLIDKTTVNPEIDVVEQYGVNPNSLHTTVHLWYPDKRHTGDGQKFIVEGMTDDFHTYGVLIDEEQIIFYYDRLELRRVPTPEAAKVPLYLLVNLALGSGWPIDHCPDPSYMYVDYVRVWAKEQEEPVGLFGK